jgi:hypothetical protein
MAATKGILELTEKIFEESNVALDESFAERVRQLGDASCKAGIKAAITYLTEKSELSDAELQMLAGGSIPEHLKLRAFEDHIEQLKSDGQFETDETEKSLSHDAFDSGLSTAIYYLLKAAKLEKIDLLSVIPSDN